MHVLFYYFATLVVQHSFVCRFLKALAFVFVHLLPLNKSIASADSSMGLSLVNLISFLVVSLLDKLALANF